MKLVSESIRGEVPYFDAGRGVAGSRSAAKGIGYSKGEWTAWQSSQRSWTVARLVNNRWSDHEFFQTEESAFECIANKPA